METQRAEVAAVAARMVVEEGMDYGAAKRRAVKQLGLGSRVALPGNDEMEAAVREYIALFMPDSQADELAALRRLALAWMERLSEFRPHLSAAVWNGTATRHSDIVLQLFCDDSKATEIALIDRQVPYQAHSVVGFNGQNVPALSVQAWCAELQETIGVHLLVHDRDDVRGALKRDASGRSARGDLTAVRQLVHDPAP